MRQDGVLDLLRAAVAADWRLGVIVIGLATNVVLAVLEVVLMRS